MLQLKNIGKTFGQTTLFDHFSLQIQKNEKILLVAPSGRGKTTLLRFLLGFEVPDYGEIYFNNQLLDKITIKSIRASLAYVSQDADLAQTDLQTLLDTIFHYKINRHITDYLSKFKELTLFFHLDSAILTKQTQALSGGERQRVALIIAFLLNRPFLILDEITSGLDYELKCLIRDYVLEQDKTILIVSHDTIWKNTPLIREVYL